MPRVVGVDIPGKKPIEIALTHVHGIGRHSALEITRSAGIKPGTRADQLTEEQFSRMVSIIDRSPTVEGELRRMVTQNIARLREINCYRGQRHRKNLPVRGQRTRTNARTRKGPKKTVAVKRAVKAAG